jgi:membrane protein YqaA with SNARE-associated domain
VKDFLYSVAGLLFQLGGLGLLGMGVLDSSFLFMPLGNDLLIVALTARHPERLPYYAAMATAGSVLGCMIIDALSRKGGEKGLEQRVSPRRLEYVKRKVSTRAAWALALAALMPPPFPFTPFVAVAAVLQYPRRRLLAVIASARLARFLAEGALAIWFGERILKLARSPEVQYAIVFVVVVSIGGSALSIYRWTRRSRGK